MPGFIHHNHCPVCNSVEFENFLSVKDHTTSGEIFEIDYCRSCTCCFTQDPPDASSIESYYQSEEYISHTGSSRGLINKVYLLVRKWSVRQKRKLIEKRTHLKKGSLLDIGSGTGVFAAAMQHAGWDVTGLEPDAGARQVAESANGIKLKQAEELFRLPPRRFDAVTLWHVLEHVHDIHGYIIQVKKLLKPGGKLFIAVPNYRSYDAKHYGQFWAAYDVPRHLYHFSAKSMKGLMEKHGFRIINILPMWFDSFYVSLLSSKYRSGKPSWFSALWTGSVSNFKCLDDRTKCSSLIYVADN